MDRLASWALRLIVVLNILATMVAFGESYSGLYQWAHHHTIVGFWAGVWPLMIDTIILVGEAALFVSHHFRWITRHKVWAWIVTMTALGVSVAANTGHVDSTDWLSRLTAALPPAALAFCMTVGLGVMKRYYANKPVIERPPLSPPSQTVLTPIVSRAESPLTKAPESPLTENVSQDETPLSERPAPVIPESLDPTETFAGMDLRVTEKSFTMPRDTREGLKLPEVRVRDMYDVDPDISANAVKESLGVAWATAKKYLDATKEARGLTA
jgi:hypothetical protein